MSSRSRSAGKGVGREVVERLRKSDDTWRSLFTDDELLTEAADYVEALEDLLVLADEVVATAKQVLENGGGTTKGVSRLYDAHEWVMGNASLLDLIPAYLAARAPSPEHEAAAAILSDYHATRMPG